MKSQWSMLDGADGMVFFNFNVSMFTIVNMFYELDRNSAVEIGNGYDEMNLLLFDSRSMC